MKRRIIVVAVIVLLTGVGLLVYFGQRQERLKELYYSGTIEATRSELSFQVGGRVVRVAVREGQLVDKDQVLAELDDSDYQARYLQAKANLDRSLKSVHQQETLLEMYRKTLPDDVAKAQASVAAARAAFEEAAKNKDRYDHLFKRSVVSEREWDVVKLNYDTAKARVEEAEAALKQARSNLKKIKVTEKEVESARAQVRASEASLEQAGLQVTYTKLRAPYRGTITSRNVEPGEVVTPGRQVLTLADLSTVDLKIFVGETEVGRVKPGQRVDVKVDTFPGKTFVGKVSFISPEGEFTPKVIQTHKERVKLVYLVKVSIPNPDIELKTGMPADAWLR